MSRNNNRNANRPQSPASQAHKAQPAEVKTSAASDPLKGLNLTKEGVQKNILHHLHSTLGTSEQKASDLAWWEATCASINELVFERLTQTQQTHFRNDTRAVHYFSAEFLMGRLTQNNLINLHLFDVYDEALKASGKSLSDLCELEPDMALGNGGLGRLAACFIDSLATLNFPAIGYGITTRTVCSVRKSRTAGRLSVLTHGVSTATPGKSAVLSLYRTFLSEDMLRPSSTRKATSRRFGTPHRLSRECLGISLSSATTARP